MDRLWRSLGLGLALAGCEADCPEATDCESCLADRACLWVLWDDGDAECIAAADKDTLPPSHAAPVEEEESCE